MSSKIIKIIVGLHLYLEITLDYLKSETRKATGIEYTMAPASGPCNLAATIGRLANGTKQVDCHLFAITGPKSKTQFPIEAAIGKELEKELKHQRVTLHPYSLREHMPISVNITEKNEKEDVKRGIRVISEYEKDKGSKILRDMKKILRNSGRNWIVLASISPYDENLALSILQMDAAKNAKKVITLSRELIMNNDLKKVRDQIIGSADYLIQNEEEVKAILLGKNLVEDHYVYAEKLRDMGPKNVILTLGEKGAIALDEKGERYSQPAFKIENVDATGAGDCFTSGFIYAISAEESFQESLRYGAAASAVQMEKRGGYSQVTLNEVREKLENGCYESTT